MAVAVEAFGVWRGLLAGVSDVDLAGPIGVVAGRHGDATRRSFALHVADELVHGVERALYRCPAG